MGGIVDGGHRWCRQRTGRQAQGIFSSSSSTYIGPLPEPYLPEGGESPEPVFEDAEVPETLKLIYAIRQSATLKSRRLVLSGTPPPQFPKKSSYLHVFFRRGRKSQADGSVAVINVTLPHGFSTLSSESRRYAKTSDPRRIHNIHVPGARFPWDPPERRASKSVFEETMRTPLMALSARKGP